MIKNIKRVGIIFLAIAIVCLMVIGCLSVNSVTSNNNYAFSSSLNKVQNDISVNYENVKEEPEKVESSATQAEREFTLSGDCDSMAEGWNNAVKVSVENNCIVKVNLGNDWIAKSDSTYKTIFGTGNAFHRGIIKIQMVHIWCLTYAVKLLIEH